MPVNRRQTRTCRRRRKANEQMIVREERKQKKKNQQLIAAGGVPKEIYGIKKVEKTVSEKPPPIIAAPKTMIKKPLPIIVAPKRISDKERLAAILGNLTESEKMIILQLAKQKALAKSKSPGYSSMPSTNATDMGPRPNLAPMGNGINRENEMNALLNKLKTMAFSSNGPPSSLPHPTRAVAISSKTAETNGRRATSVPAARNTEENLPASSKKAEASSRRATSVLGDRNAEENLTVSSKKAEASNRRTTSAVLGARNTGENLPVSSKKAESSSRRSTAVLGARNTGANTPAMSKKAESSSRRSIAVLGARNTGENIPAIKTSHYMAGAQKSEQETKFAPNIFVAKRSEAERKFSGSNALDTAAVSRKRMQPILPPSDTVAMPPSNTLVTPPKSKVVSKKDKPNAVNKKETALIKITYCAPGVTKREISSQVSLIKVKSNDEKENEILQNKPRHSHFQMTSIHPEPN